jgi:hypothetical protein
MLDELTSMAEVRIVKMQEIDLTQVERDIFRDYLQDGLLDLVMGAYFLLIGLALAGGVIAAFLAAVIFVPFLHRALKRRFTYPRTGYVELREGDPGPAPRIILGSLLLGLIVLVVVLIAVDAIGDPAQWYRWMPIPWGIWLAGILLGLGVAVRLVRYYILAFIALVAGPFFSSLSLPGKLENLGLFLVAAGAALLVWGLVIFLRFLRQHPLAEEGTGDVRE